MNFQNLQNIETADRYLDMAFSRATKKSQEMRRDVSGKDRIKKSKEIETAKLSIVNDVLREQLQRIIDSFPSLDNLDVFYNELVRITLDYGLLKKSLGSVKWTIGRIESLFSIYRIKITKTNDMDKINACRNEYYGRVSSVMKQIKKYLENIEEARKIMKAFPNIKTSMPTVCLFGFPNAGKSTVLKRLTGANPEIKEYAFTTKSLNLGYIDLQSRKIQIIDTPGTLNRPDKMKLIEMQAYLAVKHLASIIVYVFDPSLETPMESQVKLLKNLKKEFRTDILLYLSKTDICDKDTIDEFMEKYPKILTFDELKDEIIKKTALINVPEKIPQEMK